MSVSKFYDDTSPETWKKVIGEDLNYHVGWGEGDIFYNAVEHLYQFIKTKCLGKRTLIEKVLSILWY